MKGQAKIAALVILGVLVVAGVYGISAYNRMIRLHEQIPLAWSQVDNVLQRRNDLIPNLVSTVKGYAKHEQKILGDVADALKSFGRASTRQEKIAAADTISGLLSKILTVSLQYPDLKADKHFSRLSDELAGTENRIAVERMRYNETVFAYNSLVKSFPTNVIARLLGLHPEEAYFKASEPARTVPNVQF